MEEQADDLLSTLPHEILHHIISMLQFKEAVQTSLLSTSWRTLMSSSRVKIESIEEAKQIIESISQSDGGGSFETLKLHLHSSAAPLAVLTKGVHGELHLDFSSHRHHSPTLSPSPTFFNLIFEQDRFNCCPNFSRVKILHLRSVINLVAETVSDLCSNCFFLESLRIEKCGGLEKIEVGSSKSLKNFEMADCTDIVGITVSAEKLESFSYKGVFPLLQLVNVRNLVRATLDLGDGIGKNAFDCEDALYLLSSFKDVEVLTVTTWLIEALCCSGVIFSKLDFQFNKLKELNLISSKLSSKTRDSFACFSHITPSLQQLFLKVEKTPDSIVYPTFSHQHWHEPHLWKDYAAVKNEACWLKDLTKIGIVGFTMERDELLWMDLLLHIAVNVKEMLLDGCWRVARIPYSQIGYLRSNYFVMPCSHIDSYFVLIEHCRSDRL